MKQDSLHRMLQKPSTVQAESENLSPGIGYTGSFWALVRPNIGNPMPWKSRSFPPWEGCASGQLDYVLESERNPGRLRQRPAFQRILGLRQVGQSLSIRLKVVCQSAGGQMGTVSCSHDSL